MTPISIRFVRFLIQSSEFEPVGKIGFNQKTGQIVVDRSRHEIPGVLHIIKRHWWSLMRGCKGMEHNQIQSVVTNKCRVRIIPGIDTARQRRKGALIRAKQVPILRLFDSHTSSISVNSTLGHDALNHDDVNTNWLAILYWVLWLLGVALTITGPTDDRM